MPRLTRTLVDGLKPADQEYTVWDNLLPGFGVQLRSGTPRNRATCSTVLCPTNTNGACILTVEAARSLAVQCLLKSLVARPQPRRT